MLSAVQSQVQFFISNVLLVPLSAMRSPLIIFISLLTDQMGAVDSTFEELSSIFDTGGSKGLTGDLVDKIPKIKITGKNNLDASGNKDSCDYSQITGWGKRVARKKCHLLNVLSSSCRCF